MPSDIETIDYFRGPRHLVNRHVDAARGDELVGLSVDGSSLLLGVVNFTGQAPTLLFTPFAGVIADRYDRHRLLVVTQVMAMVQAAVIAVLVLTDGMAIWHLVLLSLFLGIVNAFDTPIRQSLIVEMIESREDLGNAIALNSSMMNGARLVGPPSPAF